MRRLALTIALGGTLAGLVCAQPVRSPRPWWASDISKTANLSDAQQKQILDIQHDFRVPMVQARRAVNKADADVAAAFNEEPVDQAKANDAINRLAAAHAELTRTLSQFELKLRTVLTAEQWQSIQQGRPWPARPGGRHRGQNPTPGSAPRTTTTNQK